MDKNVKNLKTSLPQNPINELKWGDSLSKDMKWLQVSNGGTEENKDIIERFTFMSNIHRGSNKRTDREEIRRRLAMGSDNDDYFNGEKTYRKPSLQIRLQSGMNLQICFMNETTSDNESMNSDSEIGTNSSQHSNKLKGDKYSSKRPDSLALNKCHFNEFSSNQINSQASISKVSLRNERIKENLINKIDFFTWQAQLQAKARLALVQAKETAHMQMELERRRLNQSPFPDMIRKSLEKVGTSFPADRRYLSRKMLTEMNITQLQIIANDFHTMIEDLNEKLVEYLICRDDLHMEQDSMLVDIEDLTRYLDANRPGTRRGTF